MKRLFTALVAIGLMLAGCSTALEHPPHLKGTATTVVTLPPSTTTTTTTVPVPTTIPVTTTVPSAPISNREAWDKVATCESGGWVVLGSVYPNSLGLTAQNWQAFGGTSDVSPEAQIAVAERFRAAYGISIPDQNGCAAW
jgi:Transglycosylase-like domain